MFLPFKISSESIRRLVSLQHSPTSFDTYYEDINRSILDYTNGEIKKQLIDGTKLQEEWFPVDGPKMNFDVFISHSHKDLDDIVLPFARWLYDRLGLRCFIDSQFWQYSDDLLKQIDDGYAYQPESGTYNYLIRNFTTSNIHIMLSMALMKMMNKTEMVIFIDSDNSIVYHKGEKATPSPWIYEEVNFASSLEMKIPKRWQTKLTAQYREGRRIEERFFSEAHKPNIQYKINISDFYGLNSNTLNQLWYSGYRGERAMDELYKSSLQAKSQRIYG